MVVDNDVDKVEIKAVTADVAASVTGTGTVNLTVGENTVKVVVTAQSGTKRTYEILISRQAPTLPDPEPTVPDPTIAGTKYTLGTYITGIAPETALADFVANLGVANGSVEVRDASGKSRADGIICSGDKVIIYKTDGSEYLTYDAVIYGDMNGDGRVTTVDLFMGQRHILSSYTLTDARLAAADINKDGKVTTVDLFMGQRHILGTYTITQ